MLRKVISTILLSLILIFWGITSLQAAELLNGGFESLDSEKKGISWYNDFWKDSSRLVLVTLKKHEGQYAALIRSDKKNDARLIQQVTVLPNTIYRFSAWIATEGVTDGFGANLCLLGGSIHSEGIMGTNDWQYKELTFRTGPYQTQVALGARLGFYSQTTKGKAYFDNLKLEIITDEKIGYQQAGNGETQPNLTELEQPILDDNAISGREENLFFRQFVSSGLMILFYLFLLVWLWVKSHNWSNSFQTKFKNYELRLFFVTLLGLILFLQCWLMKINLQEIEIGTLLTQILCLGAHLGTAWLIFEGLIKKRPALAWYLGAIVVCLPAALFNSSLGDYQTAVANFLVILSFYLLTKRMLIIAMVAAVISTIFSPLGVVATSLILIYTLKQHKLKDCLIGLAGGVVVSLVFLIILSKEQPLMWLVRIYGTLFTASSTTGSGNFVRFLTDNASASPVLKYLYSFTGLMALYFAWWGGTHFWRKPYREMLPMIFFFIGLAFFVFMPGATPSMLLTPLISLIMAVGFLKDRRLYFGIIILSLTCFFNLYSVNQEFEFLPRILYILGIVNCVLLLISAGWLSIYRKEGRKAKQQLKSYDHNLRELLFNKLNIIPFKMVKRDYLIISILILFYTMIVFFQLGSWSTPQKGLELKTPVEVVFETPVNINTFVIYDAAENGQLQVELQDATGNWIQGLLVTCNDFYVLKRQTCTLNQVSRLKLVPQGTAGFINEVAFLDANEKLIPIKAVIDPQTNQEVTANTSPLFDEQERAMVTPSYLNSTYFDEIYHGRTAHEFIRRSTVYETTHPPLGKDLLSLGILWFGMNPFGMRFMSVFSGVLLMLALFLLGREVLKTRFGAYTVVALGMLSFMPLVQCRYSTIDTFSVFFITLMFFFTFKYFRLQEAKDRGWNLPILAGIFLGFVLAMATKWTGAYGFAGTVACLLILKVRQYLAWHKLKKEEATNAKRNKSAKAKASSKQVVKSFWLSNFFPFVGIAVVSFLVIVPLTYYLSYIPFLRCQGIEETFSIKAAQAVVQSQKDMYSYHSDLRATHPYGSSWWGWPFNFKPLWIYSGNIKENHDGKTVQLKGTIASFGNPAIWLVALVGVVMLLYLLLTTRKFSVMHLVFVGFLAQYLPWILISRVTFIYHFYPCLPFFLLFAAWALEGFWRMGKEGKQCVYGYLGVCVVLFILFYPALSGMPVPEFYINNLLRWFPLDWMF